MSRDEIPQGMTVEQAIILLSIIVVIVAAVLFAVDPVMRLRTARNTQRWSDVNVLASAMRAYHDAHESFPPGIDRIARSVQVVGGDPRECLQVSCRGERIAFTHCRTPRLAEQLASFLHPLPRDPMSGTEDDTRYYVNIGERGAVIVGACDEEAEDYEGTAAPPKIQVVW